MTKHSIMKEIAFNEHKLIFKHINKKHSFAKHIHEDNYMIGLCIEGKGVFSMDNKENEVKEKMLFIIPPNTVHSCTSYNIDGKYSFLTCFIPKKFFESIASSICSKSNYTFKEYFIKDEMLFNYLEEIIKTTLHSEKLVSEEIINFISLFCEKYMTYKEKIKTIENEKFELLFKYLKEESYELKELNFYKMAEVMKMNPYYFHRIFSKTIGLTPQSFINFLRVSKATKLLKEYESLASIAQECGFYDQAHFTKEFKKYHGITPTNFKNIS
ncbi:hypothetical protein CP960_03335 [Malaciobacter halophilus]|uniref:HTH araC/xylS-type domain-containing protein n=1 Tax=Malaciobacter halophilus TaxID=197482 RepID=A0A2N1J4Y8_9BACT|nr:AraC family transcriptional regulator [Malaciobacter halophilus]AXH09596.1 transcriptional regulator, AraC family [Malaciobacter halophilus]PKI81637.1 hypothetical protein CP960_03335 [Malaciobacter halophilus]